MRSEAATSEKIAEIQCGDRRIASSKAKRWRSSASRSIRPLYLIHSEIGPLSETSVAAPGLFSRSCDQCCQKTGSIGTLGTGLLVIPALMGPLSSQQALHGFPNQALSSGRVLHVESARIRMMSCDMTIGRNGRARETTIRRYELRCEDVRHKRMMIIII